MTTDKTVMSEEDKKLMEEAFAKYDKLKEFETELSKLINRMGIDALLDAPDYILAAVAKNQMELTSQILKIKKIR